MFPQKINGMPTYSELKQLRQTIKNNAASVDTIYGGGLHGHLDLVVPANFYNMIVLPLHPQVNVTNETSQGECRLMSKLDYESTSELSL